MTCWFEITRNTYQIDLLSAVKKAYVFLTHLITFITKRFYSYISRCMPKKKVNKTLTQHESRGTFIFLRSLINIPSKALLFFD